MTEVVRQACAAEKQAREIFLLGGWEGILCARPTRLYKCLQFEQNFEAPEYLHIGTEGVYP